MKPVQDEIRDLSEISDKIIDTINGFCGTDEDKRRASVFAVGILFFRLVDILVEEDKVDEFIQDVRNLAAAIHRRENARTERANTEASEDHGEPGEGSEKGT